MVPVRDPPKRSTLKYLSPQTLAVSCQAWVVASSAQVKFVVQSYTHFYKERNKYLAGKRRIDASLRGPEYVNRNFSILFVISLQSKNAETSLSLWSHHNSGHLVVWAADASPEASWKWVLGRKNVKRTLPWSMVDKLWPTASNPKFKCHDLPHKVSHAFFSSPFFLPNIQKGKHFCLVTTSQHLIELRCLGSALAVPLAAAWNAAQDDASHYT